jgi:hypothetical protein
MRFDIGVCWSLGALVLVADGASAGAVAAPPPIEIQVARDFPGWSIDSRVEGDLDGDGQRDTVVVLKRIRSPESPEGALAVYLALRDGRLALHTKAPRAVCTGCGGVKVDPDAVVGEPAITSKGILTLTYAGGSREMWSFTTKWRLDRSSNRFLLIGDTYDVVDTIAEGPDTSGDVSHEDINYSTLRMLRKLAGKGTFACRVRPDLARIALGSFDFEKYAQEPQRFVDGTCKKVR